MNLEVKQKVQRPKIFCLRGLFVKQEEGIKEVEGVNYCPKTGATLSSLVVKFYGLIAVLITFSLGSSLLRILE